MTKMKQLGRIIALKIRVYQLHRKDNFSREKVLYPFRQLTHPIDTFNDLKYENKASIRITVTLSILFFIVRLLDQTSVAVLFNTNQTEKISMVSTVVTSVGLLVVWTVCNWATCTLIDGEGKLRDIWIMTTYSVVPYCAMTLLSIAMSYFLSQDEAIFFTTVRGIGLLWTGLLLFLGMMTAHQFTVLKTLVSIVLTLAMIIFSFFLLIIMYSITQQIQSFVTSIVTELVVRR